MSIKKVKIGNVTLDNPFILGPMAGVTDQPFRILCHEMGAALVCMEMVSANAVKYGNKKTLEFINISEDEHPVSMQLFGPDPETMAIAATQLATPTKRTSTLTTFFSASRPARKSWMRTVCAMRAASIM